MGCTQENNVYLLGPSLWPPTWLYDPATGLLTNKVYADGKGTKYSYTSDGKLSTRAWARGVTTTYRYNESGAITNIDYSDSTPDVTFGYDRQGRQTNAIAAGVAAYGFEFDPVTSAMTNEVMSLAVLPASRSLVRAYDALLRPSGIGLDNGQAVAYSYDMTGRLSAVAWTVAGNSSTARYSYVEQSGMIAGYDIEGAGGTFRTRKVFEPSRDLIASVANLFISGSSTSVVSSFDYLNDAIGRRIQRLDAGTGVPSARTNAFGYNVRSELVSAEMDTNSFGYAYDPIGNRTAATNACPVGGGNAETLTYLSNELNQYTNVADGVTNSPTYDDDGNMLTYGGWTFGWDGENRLISASNGTTVLTFVFDHQSRRIAKIAGSATNVFLYDGWAMIEEARCGAGAAATNSYVYGPDLSGTFQGAGTIGGILLADFAGTNVLFGFDANGNVTDLVATNGTLAAHYEFDPYGNVIASSGDLASANPYRFSTKYTDDETGLVYYGARFYSSELGRWTARDPLDDPGHSRGKQRGFRRYKVGRNPQLFVRNRPTMEVDVLGLASCSILLNVFNYDEVKDCGCCTYRLQGSQEARIHVADCDDPPPGYRLVCGADTSDLDLVWILTCDGPEYIGDELVASTRVGCCYYVDNPSERDPFLPPVFCRPPRVVPTPPVPPNPEPIIAVSNDGSDEPVVEVSYIVHDTMVWRVRQLLSCLL
jgi:RHS repeat-associated protein